MTQVLSRLIADNVYNRQNGIHYKRLLFVTSSSASLLFWIYNVIKKRNISRNSVNDELTYAFAQKGKSKTKLEPMAKVFADLRRILKLIVGKREYSYAVGIAVTLVLRTLCDLWMIQNGTQIEAAIITADVNKLKSNLYEFLISMPLLALVNNGLKFCINQLRLGLRYKLSVLLYNQYIDGLTYYRLNVLDTQCQNIDQLLTNDVEKFCNTIVDVYSNISKPFLDIIVLVQRLSVTYTGATTPAGMIAYLIVAGTILTNARRPLTALTVKETQLEGQLRYIHTRIISNCEEIAFYQGNKKERLTLLNALNRLRSHLYNLSLFKFNIDYLDNVIARYLATVFGYLSLSIPFLTGRYKNDPQAVRLETYYKSGRMMVKLAESIGRLVMAGRDFTRLAAYTSRVTQLMNNIESNRFSKQITASNMKSNSMYYESNTNDDLVPGAGIVELCNPQNPVIHFTNVPLCTPNGDILVQSINFAVKMGHNIIITGPNGSGKSSLFRLLGDLWPLYGGKLVKPTNDKLFYIPQRPYMALGTFREQIIYPDTHSDMCAKGITDECLLDILKIVQIDYLVERESWTSIQDWQDVLSGGEKQRVAIARLLYHKPQFAILDECTSAVSVDVEQAIYQYLCDEVKCSLLSVTHRVKQLQQYHHFVLQFDGCGGCVFKALLDDDDSVVL